MQFLVATIHGMRTPGATFMREHPALTMDFSVLPGSPSAKGEGPFQLLTMARGTPKEDVEALRALMEASYPTFRLDRPPAPDGSWLARYEVPMGPVDPVYKTVSRFMDLHGLAIRWGCLEHGILYLRALLEGRDGPRLAQELRADLAEWGLKAEISVQDSSEPEMAIWVQALREAHAHPR